MANEFLEQSEKIYRAILPIWITEQDTISSAAFKDSNGPSCDRQGDRTSEDCIDSLLARFPKCGAIVDITYGSIIANSAIIKLAPEADNGYHCILANADGSIPLTASCAKKISRAVSICRKGAKS